MVFIPEVGDHVMLGFRYNDPNRLFVMGSLFNGTTGAGGQDKNHLKSIFTRGGSTITFNELDNSILVKDPSGNTWFMDGAGNISVTAPKDITMNAGENLNINVGQNMTTTVGMNATETVGMNKITSVTLLNTLSVGGVYMMTVMGKMIRKIMGNLENNVEGNKQSVVQGELTTHSEKKHTVNAQDEMGHNSVEQTKTH